MITLGFVNLQNTKFTLTLKYSTIEEASHNLVEHQPWYDF